MSRFPEGTSFEVELKSAMERLELLGVSYPSGYFETLTGKYSSGIKYPRIFMRIGKPNIIKHPHYKEILEKRSEFLDYGCGTGDDIRRLIRDGYPKDRIIGFDIDRNGGIDIGFDLYRDREVMQDVFVVSAKFPFSRETFDVVYSGSVLHSIEDRGKLSVYLANAYNALKNSGILFGSMMGTDNYPSDPSSDVPPMLLTENELRQLLEETGFVDIEIVRADAAVPLNPKYRLWFNGNKKLD